MYTLTLELNNICNLNCRYCYLGEKTNRRMNIDTARKAVDLGVHEAKKQYDKTIFVCFMGGEPLLSLELICEIIPYIEFLCKENDLISEYGITTNGTLCNDSIYNVLVDNEFIIRLSIDGDEYTHNLNRIDYNNKGSFSIVENNLPIFKEICTRINKDLTAVQVITINNVRFYSHNFKYLVEKGICSIESGPNFYDSWSEDDINALKDNLTNTIEYMEQTNQKHKTVYWDMYYKHLNSYLRDQPCYYNCNAGMSSIFVNTQGRIYFCKESDDTLCIGDVFDKLDVRRIREIAYINETKHVECLNCACKNKCSTKGCFTENYSVNGNIFMPIKIGCEITKFFVEFFDNKYTKEDVEKIKKNYRS